MALSFEESKRQLKQQTAAASTIAAAADPGIMTLDLTAMEDEIAVAAYSEWTKSTKYRWYAQYNDERVSSVDGEKNITVDSSQINISQEENSQFIPFEMPRYYDGFDLMTTMISIHYVTSDGYYGASEAVNVVYDTATIKFAWLLDGKATHAAGKLTFEIRCIGNNAYGDAYVWKSRTFDKLTVMKSLADDKQIVLDDSWVQTLATHVAENVAEQIASVQVAEQVAAAESAAARAEAAVAEAENAAVSVLGNYYTKSEAEIYVQEQIGNIPTVDLTGYATEEFVTDAVAAVDISGQLVNYALKSELPSIEGLASEEYVRQAVSNVDVTDQLVNYALKEDVPSIEGLATEEFVRIEIGKVDVSDQLKDYALKSEIPNVDGLASETYVQEEIAKVDVSDQLASYAKNEDVYSKTETDNKVKSVSDSVATNTAGIASLNKAVEDINTTLSGVDKSPRVTYEATYGNVEMDDGTTAEYMFTLWETETGKEPTVKSRFQIMGGGGSTSSVTLKIAYVEGYGTPIVATAKDRAVIYYEFSGEDSAGDTNLDGTASWKVGNRVVATQDVSTGVNDFDLTDYMNVGDNKVVLTITHATGAVATKAWTVKIVDVRLESDFSDIRTYSANEPVSFTYTPYGSVEKTVHFLMDGKEIATKTSSAAASGLSDSYSISAQAHGTHLFEAYMTATINGQTIETDHIVKDIMWYDENLGLPVIGCADQEFTSRQHETTNITFVVVDPSTETPSVSLRATYVNDLGETVEEYSSALTMTGNTDVWQFKTAVLGEHTLTITCGDVVKVLKATITELGIEVNPITDGLVFDFNPVGHSNSDSNRLWSDGDVSMSVSENFDWVNGGWQMDANGDQYFCIKAGTSAEINYQLFADDAKVNGKQMKLIFKTTNVANTDATFMSCCSDTIGSDKVGIEMKAHEAAIYAKSESLPLPYSEDDIIEFEFNINASSETPPMVMGYEDGVSTRPMVYDATHDFQQHKDHRKTISMGSPDCDLHIYRFKVYNRSLSDRDILNNFIADARSAEEMLNRHERNQIYKDGILTPEHLAEVCPWLRIIKIEAPRFTNDKDDKVRDTTIEFIYKDGDPVLDNFVAYDSVHSGQGTSSNNYGPSGRNLDLIMKTYKDYGNQPYIILGDGSQVSKVSLTRDSVPVNYFNAKVNIASSENANNAQLAKRYNQYNPYKRPFVRDSEDEIAKIKDTMEFHNCVIFIKENDPDVSTHTEFADNNWHFYAIGNIGDSKKTDGTRLTDPDDPYECILEVMDNTLPNSTMPTGKVDEDGNPVYPISPEEWCEGNSAYDALHADKFDEKKATDKENGLADTYGWRYIYEDGTDEENDAAKAYVEQKWKDFYGFVVTSTDEEFKAHLGDWCVLDSVMYYYLFTLRYTMTDNHSKNSFWHYGKSNAVDSEGNQIRKWDLCFDYDND